MAHLLGTGEHARKGPGGSRCDNVSRSDAFAGIMTTSFALMHADGRFVWSRGAALLHNT
jgi:hypothetical protein